VRPLDRKLVRDAVRLAPQLAAVVVVMACGVAVLVMSWSMLRSLAVTHRDYAARSWFADVFVHLERAPETVSRRLAAVPGIARLETRVVHDATVELGRRGGARVTAVGRLVSLPDSAGGLNRLHLLDGRLPRPGRATDAVVSVGFATAHRLAPGDHLFAVLAGRRTRLEIVGIATSPEYVYTIGPGGPFPDDLSFGIVWLERRGLAAAFGIGEAFNDAVATLEAGANEREVCRGLDRILARYGGLGSFGRSVQTSERYLTNELRELRNMGRVAPVVFLVVTGILLHLVIARLVGTQREQIATLAAFGYTPGEIGRHYAAFAAVVLAAGALVGVVMGWWLGVRLAAMYAGFFRFPELAFRVDPAAVGWSVAVAAVAVTAGVVQAVGRAVRVAPAAALVPEAPAVYRPALPERLGLGPYLPPTTRMSIRHLERRPVASALTVLGIALGAAVMVLGMFVGDAVDRLATFQFTEVQRGDRSVTFVEPAGPAVVGALARLPGVVAVEPFRVVPAVLRHGPRERRQEILSLAPAGDLLRVLDAGGTAHRPRRDGLLMSSRLAELLGIRPGEDVEVEVLEGRRRRIRLVVAGTVDDMVGTSAWLHPEATWELLADGPAWSGAVLAIDRSRAAALDGRLADSPRVAGFVARERQLATFRGTIARTLLRMRTVNTLFAVAIACGIVATTSRQSVIERSRDLASLRVLGYTRREVTGILLVEQALLTLLAVPPGLVLGLGFVRVTTWGYDTELFRVPAVVEPRTYAAAAATILVAALAAGVVVHRLVRRIDLVAVLKARD